MKCTTHFYKLNYDFSQEFADEHYNGKESENNRKHDWEDELIITGEVDDIKVQENTSYTLRGERNGDQFAEEIEKMTVFQIFIENKQDVIMACSAAIIDHYKIENRENEIILKVFLEEEEPLTNPIPGLYIALHDFPKNLLH